MIVRSISRLAFPVAMLTIAMLSSILPQTAAAASAAESNYCSQGSGSVQSDRKDHHDAVKASLDVTCNQTQWVEWSYTITGQGRTWTQDVSQWVGFPGCGSFFPCGGSFDGDKFKINGSFQGNETYTVTGTLTVWTGRRALSDALELFPLWHTTEGNPAGAILCGSLNRQECFPAVCGPVARKHAAMTVRDVGAHDRWNLARLDRSNQ
ncbi:hypothetical protein GS504_02720 [Rhodococcus hoagii]|nr:hypothetical protein [Prescottella equi]NKS56502.1 hypothetical protein [Prescottella equi]NKS64844.1 hypothetical protein [Prescottella equi]NKS70090.1 hypothetical protein [Prescottella equi]NKZ93443.1 hypothetical protein [Prescottella equi]